MDVLTDLRSWADEWRLELEAGRPGNETIKVYLRSVGQFLAWLGQAHPDVTEPSQLTRAHARDWMRSLIEANKADGTRRVRGIAVRKWAAYMASQPDSGMVENFAAGLALPMPEAPPVPIISDDDLGMLLRSMAGNSYIDRRDTAIVRLLLDCGLRRAELVGIDLADLDLTHQQVMVMHAKGGKPRIAPFGGKTTLALRKFLRARAMHPAADSAALFLSTRPDARGGYQLRGGGVAEMIRRRCEASGLPVWHPHQFRHTWAAANKAAGLGEDQLERLAGWAKGSIMSRRYGNIVADEQARDAARRLNLGDRV